MQKAQQPEIDWQGNTPVSRRFGEPYYSLEDGLAEARHVFLSGNDLPGRFRSGFHVAELGFGTGLNLLATLAAWRAGEFAGPLTYTGFEAEILPPAILARALSAFPEIRSLAEPMLAALERRELSYETPEIRVRIISGDARRTLPPWTGRADAWFLDGFAPARNPELWQPDLLEQVARHTRAGGTAATYSAAGHVRRALAAASFTVERRPGFGRKRHMTTARLP